MQYLNYFAHKNKIYVKYIDEKGKVRYSEVKDYTPPIFMYATQGQPVDGHSIYGQPLTRLSKDESVWETKKLIEQYESANFPIYGYSKIQNSYVYEKFKGQVPDYALVHSQFLDIETECENGFPEPLLAEEVINIIGVFSTRDKKYHVFYLHHVDIISKFEGAEWDDVILYQCKTEEELLRRYVEFHTSDYPDIVTGWNSDNFDMPYLHNRIGKILGQEMQSRMSPYKIVSTREYMDEKGQPRMQVEWKGVSLIDYMLIYMKFVKKPRPNYKLDTIGKAELKETKLKHPSGIPGHLLYRNNEYFADGVKYNIQDIKLLVRMEAKIKILYNTMVMSYYSFTNFEDIHSNMRIIDMMCYMFLRNQNKYFTWNYTAAPKLPFEGAAVKATIPGKYRWVASFDVTSEYPSLIRSQNISPETITDLKYRLTPADIIGRKFDNSEIVAKGLTVAGNGTTFHRDKQGFMPDVVRWLFAERQKYKKLKVEADKAHDKELANMHDIYQLAVKLILNSIYGVTGARFFRFYDLRIAEAITLSGQSMIGWVIRDVNAALQKLMGDDKDRVIASDTDSIYVALEDIVIKKFGKEYDDDAVLEWVTNFCDTKMNDLIEKSIEKFWVYMNGTDKEALDMKREVIADDAIFIAKKRYIMSVRDKEGAKYDRYEEIKVTGVEAVKGATPEHVREAMMETYKVLLFKGKEEFYEFHNKFRTEFLALSPDDAGFSKGVNGILKWQDHSGLPMKGTPINSRAAIVWNNLIAEKGLEALYPRAVEGEAIRYIKLKPGNPVKSTVLGWMNSFPKEFEEYRPYIDYDSLFEDQYSTPIHAMALICGIKPETTTEENPFL